MVSTDQTLQVIGHRQDKIDDTHTMLDMNQIYEKIVAMMAQMSSDLKMGQKNEGVEGTNGFLKSIFLILEGMVPESGLEG